ncbi:uncharacterized protein CXorf65 homolog [Mytilus californianus]|uniref:uncharacterized protein CXorf65 homolog n=1 Tax=Mytilus californianus TaxID=6549 RepID=UPI0022468293|nr:uncharacterized protein CXorf65 homolog [Mytilus californianus]
MAFITVKYGDSQEDIFNPNCRTFNLLRCIQRRCKCNDEVELSDESGNIKFLRECPNRYASEMLTDRESLVLLRVEKKDSHGEIYVPLLNDEYISDEFRTRISTKGSGGSGSRPNSRRVRSNTRRNKKDEKKQRTESRGTAPSAKLDVKRSRSRQGK